MNLPCLVVRQCPLIFPETPRKLTRTLAGWLTDSLSALANYVCIGYSYINLLGLWK
jgi:hypothetical protein